MKERLPLVAEERELASFREYLSGKLSELYNDLTVGPVNLPHRNAIKEIISAVSQLVSDLGTSRTRSQVAETKIAAAIEAMQKARQED